MAGLAAFTETTGVTFTGMVTADLPGNVDQLRDASDAEDMGIDLWARQEHTVLSGHDDPNRISVCVRRANRSCRALDDRHEHLVRN